MTATVAARASRGAGLMLTRYVAVGLINLVVSTVLIRRLGPESWASYGVALYIVTFVDQYLGSRLLGALINVERLTASLVSAAAFAMERWGLAVLLLLAGAAAPVAALTGLREIGPCLLAAGVCACVYARRSLPLAIMERDLEYRWIAAGEILDQTTFSAVALLFVLSGDGLIGVAIALAVRGLPSLLLWHARTRVPWRGRRTDEIDAIWAFARPGSGLAACALAEGLIPIALLSGSHVADVGFLITSASVLSYPAVAATIVQRLAFPTLARAGGDVATRARAVTDLCLTATTILLPTVGLFGIAASVWLPRLFGSRWEAAWPFAASFAASFVAVGAVNALIGGLQALDRPREAFRVTLVMLAVWALLAPVPLLAGEARWTAAGLVVARLAAIAFAAARLRRLGVRVPPALILGTCAVAALCVLIGAAAVASATAGVSVACSASLVALEGFLLWRSRATLLTLVQALAPSAARAAA